MASSVCTQKTLNPNADEFKPTSIEKEEVPFQPQGNELVLYQPPQYFHPQLYQLSYYYQQNVPFYWICYKDFHPHYYQQLLLPSTEKTPQNHQSCFDKNEIFTKWAEKKSHENQSCYGKDEIFTKFEMKKKWIWAEKTSQDQSFMDKDWMRGERSIKGQNKSRPFLPPRLMSKGRQKGFFLRKQDQETTNDVSFFCNKTTVMIKNIPNQFRRDAFMLFVDHYCCVNHWEYDFLYLPIDFGTKNNVGYAFVNFTSSCAASEIQKVLKNFKWHGVMTPTGIYSSRKICDVTWARIQGKEQLVKHFLGSSFLCDTDEYLPVVFSPPRNGSTSLTMPMTIGKLATTGPSVSPMMTK